MPPGRFQLEGGYTFTRAGPGEEHAIGELLLRIGATRALEARVGVNSFAVVEAPDAGAEGFEDLSLGAKLRLVRGSGEALAPDLSLLAAISLPTGADGIGSGEVEASAVLAAATDLSERFGLGANLGFQNRVGSGERVHEPFGSLVLGVSLAERLGAFVEWFGFFPEGPAEEDSHFLDTGLTLLLGPDAQLDARVGAGLDGPDPDWFAGVGLAWRR